MAYSQQSVKEIQVLIDNISEQSAQISHSTEKQRMAVEGMSQAIIAASDSSTEVSIGASENANNSEQVLSLSQNIVDHMSKFRT